MMSYLLILLYVIVLMAHSHLIIYSMINMISTLLILLYENKNIDDTLFIINSMLNMISTLLILLYVNNNIDDTLTLYYLHMLNMISSRCAHNATKISTTQFEKLESYKQLCRKVVM